MILRFRPAFLVSAALLSVAMTGCATCTNPLLQVGEPVDAQLIGVWKSDSPSSQDLLIIGRNDFGPVEADKEKADKEDKEESAAAETMRLVRVELNTHDKSRLGPPISCRFTATRCGDDCYIDCTLDYWERFTLNGIWAQILEESSDRDRPNVDKFVKKTMPKLAKKAPQEHLIMRYVLNGDTLEIYPMHPDAADQAIRDGKLTGQITRERILSSVTTTSVKVTASSKKLSRVLAKDEQHTFCPDSGKLVFTRVPFEPPKE